MKTEQFTTWLMEQEILRRRRKDPIKPCDAIGMGAARRRTLLHGRDVPTKTEALACAHYALRMELPFALESAALSVFVEQHLGDPRSTMLWLGATPSVLADQMRGYRINAHKEQAPAPVNPTLARALHWIVQNGPFTPYGDR